MRTPRVLLGVLTGLLLVLGAATPAEADEPVERVVVVGAPGLSWSDIDETSTPILYDLALAGGVAALTVRAVRSRSCAVDGWLTLSAGRRAADLPGPCREPEAVGSSGDVPHWEDYLTAATADSYGSRPGTLGSAAAEAEQCIGALGPGAAIGAADESGRARVVAAEATVEGTADGVAGDACRVTMVDGGTLPVDPASRGSALRSLDDVVGGVVSAVGPGTRVVVAGMGDGLSPVRPRAVIVSGLGAGLLTSPSTRQPGLVQLQDLSASLLDWAGARDAGSTGRPVTVEPDSAPAEERIEDLRGFEVRAGTLRAVSPQVTGWLAASFALWCGLAGLSLWRRGRVGGRVVAAGVALAAVPVSTFAANLVPWWRTGAAPITFTAVLAVVVATVTAVALLAGRRWSLGGLFVVSLLTLLVIGGDVLTGSGLQLASVFGQNPTVGGRFYGVGNTSYALYGVAALALVAILATARWRRPWERWAVASVVLVTATAVEGLPSLGADFGGPPGLLLGGLVILAGASGLHVTVGRVTAAVVGVVGVTAVGAVLDWSRPVAARTHLGEFVQTVVDGDLGDVLGRKVSQNLTNLTSPPLLTLSVAAGVLAVTAWRSGWRPSTTGSLVLRGSAVLAVVGFAVNDSGLVIPAFAALVLLPLLAADRGSSVRGDRLDELDEDPARVLGMDEVDA